MKPSLTPYFAWNASRYSARSCFDGRHVDFVERREQGGLLLSLTSRSAMRRRMRLIGTISSSSPSACSACRSRVLSRAACLFGLFRRPACCLFARFDVSQHILAAEAGAFRFDVGRGQAVFAERAASGGGNGDVGVTAWPASLGRLPVLRICHDRRLLFVACRCRLDLRLLCSRPVWSGLAVGDVFASVSR